MVIVGIVIGSGSVALAEPSEFEPDFYVFFEECQSMAAVRRPNADPIRTLKLAGNVMACERTRKRGVSCVIRFDDSSKPGVLDGAITDDTMISLTIQSKNGADFIDINPENKSAVSITRMWGESFLAAKVCHGTYLTADEAAALRSREPAP
ncbi:MAG: hypothetical protein AB7P03_12055 [Kofleriaceae bacterium]